MDLIPVSVLDVHCYDRIAWGWSKMTQLEAGDRVCIVGGGPAGSLAALHLMDEARRRDVKLDVTIFEPRNFNMPGPGGCNHCAGLLSHHVTRGLERLGLTLPSDVIQARIGSYALHLNGELRQIHPSDPGREILAVYRGAGPRDNPFAQPVASFDQFLLTAAVDRGARLVPHRAVKVAEGLRPQVHTQGESFPADLVILASGVNSRSPLDLSFGYRPPKTAVMAQDEVPRPEGWPADRVEAFFKTPPGLVFGAIIPKGGFLNISLLGKHLPTDAVPAFVESRGHEARLPRLPRSLCGCTPRVAVRPAGRYYGHRWVAVGDAAVTRLYKDGIGSAMTTTGAAMRAVVGRGVSSGDFRRWYRPTFRAVARDNLFGRILFRMWSLTLERDRLAEAWLRTFDRESTRPHEKRPLHRILWGMLTGDEPYERLFRRAMDPSMLWSLARSLR